MPSAPHPFLVHTLRRLFAPVLHRHGREAPALRGVELRPAWPRDMLEIVATFDGLGDQHYVVPEAVVMETGAWRDVAEFADDLRVHAQRVWSEAYEDRLIQEGRRAMGRLVREAYDRGDFRVGDELRRAYECNVEHIARFHQEPPPAPVFRWDIGARYPRPDSVVTFSTGEISPLPMTATEIRRRLDELPGSAVREQQRRLSDMMRQMYERMQRSLMGSPQHWDEAGINPWSFFDEPGSAEAQAKGVALLKENLTPAQRQQYEEGRYFDVKGGATGKTYRIYHGRQMNVRELDKKGKAVCGWCFLPAGGLVAGDVMLAQKTALELVEKDALKVANRFEV